VGVINIEKFTEVLEHPKIAIKMKKGLSLPYRFQTATSTDEAGSAFPLLVSMHAMKSNTTVSKLRHDDWNFLSPIDCYDYKEEGSFWVEGYPELTLLDMIVELVEGYKKNKLFNGDVYIIGSSSSGIACAYLANKLNAQAVYLNVPVLSSNTIKSLSKTPFGRYFKVFGDGGVDEHAVDYIFKGMKTRFHIIDQRFGFKDFVVLNSFPFVERCLELGINVHYELLPTSGHTVNYPMSHVLELFSKYLNNGRVLSTGFPAFVGEDGIAVDDVKNL
jgi:hypothetical protein